jgi:hypothetical protein
MNNFKLIVVLSLLTFFSQAQKDTIKREKTTKGGFALQLGTGNLYGGIGLMAEYQHILTKTLRFTPFGSAGMEIGRTDITGIWRGYCVGGNIEYGKAQRVFGGLSFGTHGVGYNIRTITTNGRPQTEVYNKHVLSGPSLNAGYKGISHIGLIWQTSIGLSYINYSNTKEADYSFAPSASLGVGYKF